MSVVQNVLGASGRKVALDQVRRHWQVMRRIGSRLELALGPSLDTVLLHELAYPLFTDADASGQQLLPHAWPAIFALDLYLDGLDVRQ